MGDSPYRDDDLVYVDPRSRSIVGKVEWSASGQPKPLAMQDIDVEEDDSDRRHRRQRTYPWGTYRSMKRVYKIDDWKTAEDRRISLNEAMEKATREAYWD